MTTIVNRPESMGATLAKALGQTATAAVKTHNERSDEQALQKAVLDLQEGYSMRDLLTAIGATRAAPEAKEKFLNNALGVAKFEKEKETASKTAAHQQAQEKHQQDQLAEQNRHNLATEGEKANKPVKPAPLTEFQKGLAKENVKQYVKAESDLVEADKTLRDLDRIEELNKKVGPLDSINPFNEESAELNSLGYTAIAPIVHIFNPVGPIAQKKLENILKTFGIKATDTREQIRGKVTALRRYAADTKALSERKIALMKEYDGNPPIGELTKIDAAGRRLTDDMERGGTPARYYLKANGREVVAPDQATLDQWLTQGLVTDVKP